MYYVAERRQFRAISTFGPVTEYTDTCQVASFSCQLTSNDRLSAKIGCLKGSPVAFKADRLRAMREARGWRPAELARAAGTTEGQISRYENCQRAPSADVVAKLAIALEISADFFLGIDNRFADLPDQRNVASCLTLEWHGREAEIDRDEYVDLLKIAREAESPPVSIAGWITVRDALGIAAAKALVQPGATPRRPLGRVRRSRAPGGLS